MPTICIDTWHAKAALDMLANKIDVNDADGLAHLPCASYGGIVRRCAANNLADATRHALTRWTELPRFLDDGRIEIDPNTVERSIRPSGRGQAQLVACRLARGRRARGRALPGDGDCQGERGRAPGLHRRRACPIGGRPACDLLGRTHSVELAAGDHVARRRRATREHQTTLTMFRELVEVELSS